MHTFEIRVSEALLNQIHTKRIFRRMGLLLLAFGLIGAGVIMDWRDHSLQKISVVGLTVSVFACVLYATAYVRQRLTLREYMKKIGDNPLRYTLSSEMIVGESPLGKTELNWSTFRKFLITDMYSLLYWDKFNCLTLPTPQIPPDELTFLIEQLKQRNIPVRDKRCMIPRNGHNVRPIS